MFGCGSSGGLFQFDEQVVAANLTGRSADRLRHADEIDRDVLDEHAERRHFPRRQLIKGGAGATLLGLLAACAPQQPSTDRFPGAAEKLAAPPEGKVVTVESKTGTGGTVVLGQFDTTREPVATIESGDTVAYPKTLTHFLGEMQKGTPIEEIARLRVANPGKGPHTIIGPVAVKGAAIGDVLEVYFRKLRPIEWGANFHNPGNLGTGALASEFPQGQVRYFDLDRDKMTTKFADGITLPLAPFQGTFGVAQPPEEPPVVSSVPPGRHAGNLDLRHQNEGTKLYIPVWRPNALVFTGDSHVIQGDGEVNLTAIESAMDEVRVTVNLHKGKLSQVPEKERWPIAETATDWIILATDRDLRQAFQTALLNTLRFFVDRVGLTRADAYSLASVVVSFRITQVVDVNLGVHAMVPKSIFSEDKRKTISVV